MHNMNDPRLYICREREYYEEPRMQALFGVSKSELDAAELTTHGVIREEITRVLCLARDPQKYMESVMDERVERGEPPIPNYQDVSSPKQDTGTADRVAVDLQGTEKLLYYRDMENKGILAPVRVGDICTRAAGLFTMVVKIDADGQFYTVPPKDQPELQGHTLTADIISKFAYRKVGSVTTTPDLAKEFDLTDIKL